MTTYHFDEVIVWVGLAGDVRGAAGVRSISVIDPATGLAPTTLTQGGVTVAYLTAGTNGRATFTATSDVVVHDFGAGPVAAYSTERLAAAAGGVDTTDPRLSDARTPTAHTQAATTISNSTTVGRAVLTAISAAAARTAMGAGTSNLALGSTPGYALDAGTTIVTLPASNGTDDTAEINAVLVANAGYVVRGYPGADYVLSAPIVVYSGTTLDMTGCTITGNPVKNLLQNFAALASRSVTNGATTAGSTTVTSATAAFTSADVGKAVSVLGAGQNYGRSDAPGSLYGTVVSVTSGTAIVLSRAATATVTGKKLSVYPARDVDITVTGGIWNSGNKDSVYAGLDGHAFLLRRIDGVHLSPTRMTSSGTSGFGGRFAISLGDVTDVEAHDTTYDTAGDGIHVAGPSARISIRDQYGTTGDDMVAFTGVDGQSVAGDLRGDVEGDITSISVIGIHSDGSWRALRLVSGTGTNGVQRVLSGLHAHDITGTTVNEVVLASNYAGVSVVSGEITGVSATPGSGFVRYASTATTASIIGMNHTQTGTATLTSPTTTMAVTGTVPFGVTFAAPPTLLTATPITSAGVIVSTYPVTVTATGFQVRYKASGSVGSNVDAWWIAVGVLA